MNDKEHDHNEEMSMEDLVDNNNVLLNTLINLLVKKKIITEEEFTKEINEFVKSVQEE